MMENKNAKTAKPTHSTPKQSFLRRSLNFFVRHWLVSALITVLPTVFVRIQSLLSDKALSIFKWVFLVLTIIISIFTILRFYFDHIDRKKRLNADFFYQNVIEFDADMQKRITDEMYKKIYSGDYKNKCTKPFPPFNNISSHLSPESAIKSYSNALEELLRNYFGPEDYKLGPIGISLFLKPKDSSFREIYRNNHADSDLSLDEMLCTDSKSTLNYIISKKIHDPFLENKATAYANKRYMLAPTEKEETLNGSIYCHNMIIAQEGTCRANLFLFIVTYTQPICDEDDFYSRERVITLFKKYESELQREVANILFYEHVGMRKPN